MFHKIKRLIKKAVVGCLWLLTKNKVKGNKIFFVSYYGTQMSDNPMAIYQGLLKNSDKYSFVWAYNRWRELDKKEYPNTKFIKYSGRLNLRLYYHLFTSKIIINNSRFGLDIRKKENQYYIQTWHASMGLKKIEKDVANQLSEGYCKMAELDSKYTDLLLAGCRFKKEAYKRNFWYDGEITEFGTPRNDIFFADNKEAISKKVKADLNIPIASKIFLYAPTFRKANTDYIDAFDENRLQQVLGDDWKIVVRLHPNELLKKNSVLKNRNVIDATKYNDLQGLLIATDLFATDYSSTMFDFFIQKKPCFLFCPDFEDYVGKERDLNFTFDELPFDLSRSMEELLFNIRDFDEVKYLERLDEFNQLIGSYETGQATECMVKIINALIEGKGYVK